MSLAGVDLSDLEARGAQILAKLYDLAEERSTYGQEIVFRTCPECGAREEYAEAGRRAGRTLTAKDGTQRDEFQASAGLRLVMRHDYHRHEGTRVREVAPLERPRRAASAFSGPFGGRDD